MTLRDFLDRLGDDKPIRFQKPYRFGEGKEETLFLATEHGQMAFRIAVADQVEYFGKYSGEAEFTVKSDDEVLADAIAFQKEMTEEEYENF